MGPRSPPSASLPPRPPKPISTISPALPIPPVTPTVHRPRGIGRGHPLNAHPSLPPKPMGLPGRPLPRETEALVLTGGNDDGHAYTTPNKQQRKHNSHATNPDRPMDAAVVNLTPQNHVRPSAMASHSPPPQLPAPRTITPPQDSPLFQKRSSPEQVAPTASDTRDGNGNGYAAHPDANGHGNGHANGHSNGYANGGHWQPPPDGMGYGFPQPMPMENGFHFDEGFRPAQHYPPPPQPGFYPVYQPETITPPSSAMYFPPPRPFPPPVFDAMIGADGMGSRNDSRVASPFDGRFYGPPPEMIGYPQRFEGCREPPPQGQMSTNPRLRTLNFTADGKETKPTTPSPLPVSIQQPQRVESMGTPQIPVQRYVQEQFLSDRLSDVNVCLCLGNEQHLLPAHSFILGSSPKLLDYLSKPSSGRDERPSIRRWADSDSDTDSENDHQPIQCVGVGHKLDLYLETSNKFITKDAFRLVLRRMYTSHHVVEEYLSVHSIRPDNYIPLESLSLDGTTSPAYPSVQIQQLERSISVLAAGALLGLDDVVLTAINSIKTWGLTLHGSGLERLLGFILHESEEAKADGALNSSDCWYWNFTTNTLSEALDYLVSNCPEDFKLDFRAPESPHLPRLPGNSTHPSTGTSTPVTPSQRPIRTVYSTIFLSLPYDLLKRVLEHPALNPNCTIKQRYEMAQGIVQERERRRKREIKCIQEMTLGPKEKEGGRMEEMPDVLLWEESVVHSFGSPGCGLEITRRRKGAPGGRLLWKVGKT